MMALVYEYPTYYQIIITDGSEENSFSYDFNKEQELETSIREAELLAQDIIDKRNPQPIFI